MSKPIAYIVRHPEVDKKYHDMFVSWTDVDISPEGWKQAEETMRILHTKDIEVVYSSPLKRAIEFAELLSDDVRQVRALLPWNRGVLTGLLKSEADPTLKLFMKNPKIRIPLGESRFECEQRIEDFYGPALKEAEKHTAAFFTHHSNIDILNSLVVGERSDEPVNLIKPSGIVAVYVDGDGWQLEAIHNADEKTMASMS